MLEVIELTKRFGDLVAVDGVSFQVSRGEVLGFLGPNGAGKSTTMKMITGFIAPDAGRVQVGDDDIAQNPVEVKRRIGYLPEGAPLYGDMTVSGFLRFTAEIRGFRSAERQRCIDRVVELVHLASVLEQPIETLSKGFKRRVGLAQAIIHDPEVLILDEPTDGLDPNQKHDVRELIRTMAKDKIIVLSTHILEEVDAVCNRAIIIAAGRIVTDGTPAELVARSERHNAVSIMVREHAANGIRDALAALPNVRRVDVVQVNAGRIHLEVLPEGGETLIENVSRAIRERKWEVEEIRVERGQLDEVFRSVTIGRNPSE